MRTAKQWSGRPEVVGFLPWTAVFLLVGLAFGQQERVLFSGYAAIPARQVRSVSFQTTAAFTRARIAGNVHASGGTGNDIRVLVLKDQQVVFDSGRRRSVVLSVDFSEPGQYTLVFDNRFSAVSAKTIAGTISLVTWGIDAEATQNYHEQLNYGQLAATRVLDRLFEALRRDEAELGTHQLGTVPTIRIVDNPAINASAIWQTNTLTITTGLLRFSSSQGDQSDDVLAGTVAHELAHIFYKHTLGRNRTGIGLIDELTKVSPLDRVQESEADILGIRVACQAGFWPYGLLIVMQEFQREMPGPTMAGSNHPSPASRLQYLRREAEKCEQVRTAQQISASQGIQQESHRTRPVPISTNTYTAQLSNGTEVTFFDIRFFDIIGNPIFGAYLPADAERIVHGHRVTVYLHKSDNTWCTFDVSAQHKTWVQGVTPSDRVYFFPDRETTVNPPYLKPEEIVEFQIAIY